MITREQVADLREGDVVEITDRDCPGVSVRGPLSVNDEGYLMVGDYVIVRRPDGSVFSGGSLTLTVVSRVPRPLYVNHPRPEPVDGDIVRDGDGDAWQCKRGRWHLCGGSSPRGVEDISDCSPLTLLWNGETGQVVP